MCTFRECSSQLIAHYRFKSVTEFVASVRSWGLIANLKLCVLAGITKVDLLPSEKVMFFKFRS